MCVERKEIHMSRFWKPFLAGICLLLLLLSSCSKQPGSGEYQKIDAEQAKSIMDQEEDIVILDVRTKAEYDQGYIANAVLIPDTSLKDEVEEKIPDKNTKILIYCRSGRRSAQAAKQLIEMGYTDVLDFGGIIDWPYEIVTD
jgi:phage shock protein E